MSNYICEELVAQIFLSLPSKSLIRFRSLSKSWYSRISSPSFIRIHAFRSARNPQKALVKQEIIYSRGYGTESCTQIEIPSPRKFLIDNFEIAGSCNGIICLLENEFDISLWNPSIRRKLTLPHHPHHPLKGLNIAVGFGFDPISDDYKIERISYSYGKSVNDSFVYTLKTGDWCAIASPTSVLHHVSSHVTCVNGVLHWMDQYYSNGQRGRIMTFNLSNHVFGMISLPLWVPISIEGSLAPWNDDWIKVITKNSTNVTSFSMDLLLTSQGLLEVYNSETGVCTKLVHLTASRFNAERSMCVESLELLDTGAPCNGFVGTIGKNLVAGFYPMLIR